MRFLSFKSLSISRPNTSWIIWKLKAEPLAEDFVDELDGIEFVGNVVVVVAGNDEYDWDDAGKTAAIPPPLEAE